MLDKNATTDLDSQLQRQLFYLRYSGPPLRLLTNRSGSSFVYLYSLHSYVPRPREETGGTMVMPNVYKINQ